MAKRYKFSKKGKKIRKVLFGDGRTMLLLHTEPSNQTGKWKYYFRESISPLYILVLTIIFFSSVFGFVVLQMIGMFIGLVASTGVSFAVISLSGTTLSKIKPLLLGENALIGNPAYEKSAQIFTYYCPNYDSDGKRLPIENNPISFRQSIIDGLEDMTTILQDHIVTLQANLKSLSRSSKEEFDSRVGELEKITEAVISKSKAPRYERYYGPYGPDYYNIPGEGERGG